MNFKEIQLANIGNGKAVKQFEFELQRVLENCRDPNTDPTAMREVRLVVKIKPQQDRTRAEITFQASAKICPDAPGTETVFFSGKAAYVSNAQQLDLDGVKNVKEIGAAKPAANGEEEPN